MVNSGFHAQGNLEQLKQCCRRVMRLMDKGAESSSRLEAHRLRAANKLVELQIVETRPGVRGDTQAVVQAAKMETGAEVRFVFVAQDEKIKLIQEQRIGLCVK